MRILFAPACMVMVSGLALAQSRGPALDPEMQLQLDLERSLADIRELPPKTCEDKEGRAAWSDGLADALSPNVAFDATQPIISFSKKTTRFACDSFRKAKPQLNCCKSAYLVASELFARLIKDAEARCSSGDSTLAYRLNTKSYDSYREGIWQSSAACSEHTEDHTKESIGTIAFNLCEQNSEWFEPATAIDADQLSIDPAQHDAIAQCGGKRSGAKYKGLANKFAFNAGWYGPVRSCILAHYTTAKPAAQSATTGLPKSVKITPIGTGSVTNENNAAGNAQ